MIAALYDIHGNLPALEAVLRDMAHEDVQCVVVGGDVLPGPMPREVLDRLLALETPVHFISGNGERESLALKRGAPSTVPETYRHAVRWSAEALRPDQEQLIAKWPLTLTLRSNARNVLFCHATPQSDSDIFTGVTPEVKVLPWFSSVEADLVVCGHTHMQFDRMIGRVRVVNAGSVGMPFDEPGAYWLLLGANVQLRRTAYDLQDTARRIRASRYPMAEEFAATFVLNPPSSEQMIALFEQAPPVAGQA